MFDIVGQGLTGVGKELIDKIGQAIGWRTTSIAKMQAKESFIEEIKQSELAPLEKAAIIGNVGKIIKEYNNQVNVVKKAIPLLTDNAKPNNIDEDWIASFLDKVRLISNDELQLIWAHIIAGEAEKPNSYSLRTLEMLKNLNKDEALLFQKMAKVALSGGGSTFILNEKNFPKNGIMFSEILRMEECGVLSSTSARYTIHINKDDYTVMFYNGEVIVRSKSILDNSVDIDLGVYVLSRTGQELLKAITIDQNRQYIIEVLKHLQVVYENSVQIIGNDVIEITDNKIEFNDEDNILSE